MVPYMHLQAGEWESVPYRLGFKWRLLSRGGQESGEVHFLMLAR